MIGRVDRSGTVRRRSGGRQSMLGKLRAVAAVATVAAATAAIAAAVAAPRASAAGMSTPAVSMPGVAGARTIATATSTAGRPAAADDEIAVFLAPRARVTPALLSAVGRRLGAVSGPLAGSSEFVVFFRVARGDAATTITAAQHLVFSSGAVAAIGPVCYLGDLRPSHRVVPTGDVVITCRSAAAADRLVRDASGDGAVATPRRAGARRVVVRAPSPAEAPTAAVRLAGRPGVVAAVADAYRPRAARATPDDPLFPNQWNLDNPGAGIDADVLPAWDTVLGSPDQVIGVVDDGVEIGHVDLAANVVPGLSRDLVGGDDDPSPAKAWEVHGTACAGVAAARGFNGRGVAGVAPLAGLAGVRLMGASTDANEATAMSHARQSIDVYSCSWGPEDDRHLEAPGPLTTAALGDGAVRGRGGRGSVFVWAAGNGLQERDDANFDGYANSRFVAAVAACDEAGRQTYYSERGANLLVTAPSSGTGRGITTVDRSGPAGYASGDYTSGFGGTSAAAPLVAGTVALMLQANPDLTWRDVQVVLATTAVRNDPTDAGWTQNGAGRWVNHKYGFGLVDTAAAVAAAAGWTTLGPQAHAEAAAAPAAAIPDDDVAGVASQVTIADAITVESVEVVLSAPHEEWNDLRVELVSPSGTSSLLAEQSASTGWGSGYAAWRFMTRRCLGESSLGDWTLRVSDRVAGDVGTLDAWTLRVHGRPAGAWVDDTAPVTTVTGADGWHRDDAVVVFEPFDPDSVVARTEYRLDAGPWTVATGLTVPAPADHTNDGVHVLEYHSFDVDGPVEDVATTTVAIDTAGPDARAPRRTVVSRGATAALAFKVIDALSPRATVTIRVRTLAGRTLKTVTLRDRRTNVALAYRFRCYLRRGTYSFAVTARDLAGNRQTHSGVNRLVVR